MSDGMDAIDYAFISFLLLMMFLLGALAGWEGFKLTHSVVCWEEIGRCVAAPWS